MSRTIHTDGRSNHLTRDIGPHYSLPKTSYWKRHLRKIARKVIRKLIESEITQ